MNSEQGRLKLINEEKDYNSWKRLLIYEVGYTLRDMTLSKRGIGNCDDGIQDLMENIFLNEQISVTFNGNIFNLSYQALQKLYVLETTLSPSMILCLCSEESQCQYDKVREINSVYAASMHLGYEWMKLATCKCPQWTCGEFCQHFQNPCDYHICYTGALNLYTYKFFQAEI